MSAPVLVRAPTGAVQVRTLPGWPPNGTLIAEIFDNSYADVIAAAPDMLAALREIVAMTDEDAGTFRKRGGTYRGLVGIAARAAIAKAEGRS
jgi:hypothetical protein